MESKERTETLTEGSLRWLRTPPPREVKIDVDVNKHLEETFLKSGILLVTVQLDQGNPERMPRQF